MRDTTKKGVLNFNQIRLEKMLIRFLISRFTASRLEIFSVFVPNSLKTTERACEFLYLGGDSLCQPDLAGKAQFF
jgi:hypothetical protein